MLPYRMISLKQISTPRYRSVVAVFFCVMALGGCRSAYDDLRPTGEQTTCIRKFQPAFRADWYTTSVDVYGHHISGLLLFKVMPDSAVRVVFTNEVGVTFFDFEFTKNDDFRVHQINSQLDRKIVINLLRKDFELLMMRRLGNKPLRIFKRQNEYFDALPGKRETDYFITDKDCASLLRIEKASKRKKMVEVKLVETAGSAPDSVSLQHFTFNMHIALKKLPR